MKRRLLLVAAVLVIAVATSVAQMTPELHRPTAIRGEATFFGFGPAGTLITPKRHAPFSAVIVEQMQQTLSDGTNITRQNEETVMRDGHGRIYRARKVVRPPHAVPRRAGGLAIEPPPAMIITITDPVRHVQYMCMPIRRCSRSEYRGRHTPFLPDPRRMPGYTVEDLGPSTISGIEVVGTRITRVYAEGTQGNDRPFTVSEEFWHSSALGVDVQVKRSDPRMGTRTTTMTEVSLGEPDPSYFQVPEGYTVVDRVAPIDRPMGPAPPTPLTPPMEPMPPMSVPPSR